MPPIFLNPQTIYRVQLYSSTWSLVEDVDPYVPPMPVTGNGQIVLDVQGEPTIIAPVPGGSGVTFTVNARAGGTVHWNLSVQLRERRQSSRTTPWWLGRRSLRSLPRTSRGQHDSTNEVVASHLRQRAVLHPSVAITRELPDGRWSSC